MHRILIVDDSPTMRKLIRFALLREPNLELAEAEEGLAALRMLSEQEFDLAFVDINMPMLDGLKLAAMVREDASLREIKLVMVTTEGDERVRSRARELGVDGYLAKPVTAPAIREALRKLLPGR